MGNCKSTQPEQHILVGEEEDFPEQLRNGRHRLLRLRKLPSEDDFDQDERIRLHVDTTTDIDDHQEHRAIPSHEEEDDDTLIFEAIKADDNISPTSELTLQTVPLTPEEESLFSFPQLESTKSSTSISISSVVSSPPPKGVDDSFGADQPPSPSPQKDKSGSFDSSPLFWSSSNQSVTSVISSTTAMSSSLLSTASMLSTRSSASRHSHGPSKAFQKRLQKARYVQMVVSSPTPQLTTDSSLSRNTCSFSSSLDDSSIRSNLFDTRPQTLGGIHSGFSASAKYSLHGNHKKKIGKASSNNMLDGDKRHSHLSYDRGSVDAHTANNQFEASLNKHGMVWTEFQAGSPALTVAMSNGEVGAFVVMAVGTENGRLLMTELLDFGPSNMGQPLQEVWQKEGRIRAIDFLPGDGKCIACAGDDGICTLLGLEGWTCDQEDESRTLEDGQVHVLAEIRQDDRIYACNFSPDGQYLALGGYDQSVIIVDVTSLTAPMKIAEIPVNALVSTLSWSPDSLFLAIGGSDKVCTIVENTGVDSFEIFCEIRRSAAIHTLQWNPSSSNTSKYDLAIGSNNLVVLDRESMTVQQEIHFEPPAVEEEALTPTSSQASFCSSSASVNSGASPVSRIQDMCWSPESGIYLVTCDNYNRINILETKSFSTIHESRLDSMVNCMAWGYHQCPEDGQYLCVGAQDGKVMVMKTKGSGYLLDDADLISETDASSARGRSIEWTLKDHTFLDAEDPSADGFSASADKSMGLASNSQQAAANHTPESQGGSISAVAFSHGSKSKTSSYFAMASSNGVVTVRDGIKFKTLCQLEFLEPISCIAFSNGSTLMACGSTDGSVRIVETAPVWSVVMVIDAGSSVKSISFSNDNERLAIVGEDDEILTLLDPEMNFTPALHMEQQSAITAVEWGSEYLAFACQDACVAIHETGKVFENCDEVYTTLVRKSPARALSFDSGSRFLVVGGDDKMLGVYSSQGKWALVHRVCVDIPISHLQWTPDSGRHLAVGNSREVKILDTVFWADVEEARDALSGETEEFSQFNEIDGFPRDDCESEGKISRTQSLAFSQDGKFLAFSHENTGRTKIVNTTTWDVVYKVDQL